MTGTKTPWEIAKPILKACYEAGEITDDMRLTDVINMREEFKAVPYNNFRKNFGTLKKSVKRSKPTPSAGYNSEGEENEQDEAGAEGEEEEGADGDQPNQENIEPTTGKKTTKKPKPWDIAKPILRKFYINGIITKDMKPSEVVTIRDEFKAVPYKSFVTNFRTLKISVNLDKERSERDLALLTSALWTQTLAKNTPGCWDGSEAQEELKKDMEAGLHLTMKPAELRMTKEVYQRFEPKEFKDHIHQAKRAGLASNYWLYKKAKWKKNTDEDDEEETYEYEHDAGEDEWDEDDGYNYDYTQTLVALEEWCL